MKKIMFTDKFGLNEAVLDKIKTNTRRSISNKLWKKWDEVKTPDSTEEDLIRFLLDNSPYKLGEVVSVAQSYKDAGFHPDTQMEQEIRGSKTKGVLYCPIRYVGGWNNKLFVAPNMMPHRIRITDVRVERLQDISDEDCLAEGVDSWVCYGKRYYGFFDQSKDKFIRSESPREAYAALIERISGKGTWESNPYVFVYEFELIK